MKKFMVILAILMVVAFILAGCGGQTSPSTTPAVTSPTATTTTPTTTSPASTTPSTKPTATTTTPTTTAKSGGTLTILITADPSSLYPPTMTGQTDGQTSSVCLETLFRYDEQLNLIPLLATDWKADVQAKTITITLRQGIKFQDGTDFNAEACKWNLDQFRAGTRAELKKVSSVDVVDNYTVRLNLSQFDNTIVTNLGNVSDAGRMISPTAFEKNGGKDWAVKNAVGTGPFQFVSMTKDVGISWKRFDGYWGGKPYLDGIEMKRIADSTVALMEFKAGNLHILGTAAPRDGKALEAEGKYVVIVPPEGQVPALAGYAKDPTSPFADIRVRQAIAYAINVPEFIDSFGLGYWRAQNQWAVPGTWGYNPDVVGYPYNPGKAKQLLALAGYPNGLKTILNFFSTSQSVVDENTALQNYLNQAGFDVTLNPLQRPAFADMASNGKGWSGIVRQQGFSSPDPLVKYAGVIAGAEFTGTYVPQEMVDVYNQAVGAGDFAAKQTLVHQLMSLAVDKYCIAAYLAVQSSPIAKAKTVHDDMYGEAPYRYLSPLTWID